MVFSGSQRCRNEGKKKAKVTAKTTTMVYPEARPPKIGSSDAM